MTNPLQTRFQTPYKLGYIPCANRLHPPCTHIPHTPYGFAPAFGGGVQPSSKISTDAPLRESHPLERRDASRVPALSYVWKYLYSGYLLIKRILISIENGAVVSPNARNQFTTPFIKVLGATSTTDNTSVDYIIIFAQFQFLNSWDFAFPRLFNARYFCKVATTRALQPKLIRQHVLTVRGCGNAKHSNKNQIFHKMSPIICVRNGKALICCNCHR